MTHRHGFRTLHREEIEGAARFLTFSCDHGRSIFVERWRRMEFVEALGKYSRSGLMELHAWSLMPDHVHLLLTPIDGPLGPSLSLFKGSVARRIARRESGLGPVWREGGGYDRTIVGFGELREKRRYIHRNAVRAGLAPDMRSWAWHSWHEVFGVSRPEMPLIVPVVGARLTRARETWLVRQRELGRI